MKYIPKSKIMLFVIISLNIFLIVEGQLDDDISMKIFSCMKVVSQKNGGEGYEESPINSPAMLACFMKITPDQIDSISSNYYETGIVPLEEEEINALTDVESLKDYSDDELREKTNELEEAIKEYNKFNEDYPRENYENENYYGDGDDYNNINDDYNYNYNDNDYESNEKFSDKIKEFFDENTMIVIWIVICVVVFILIAVFGKEYEEKNPKEDDKEKNIDKDKNKNE